MCVYQNIHACVCVCMRVCLCVYVHVKVYEFFQPHGAVCVINSYSFHTAGTLGTKSIHVWFVSVSVSCED